LNKNIRQNSELASEVLTGETIVVTAETADKNVKSVEMSAIEINPVKIEPVPVLLGEQDILKTIQLLPGVKSAGEGNSGFYVRGGGSDQNLILLDEAPVFSASHLLGFFSVFNSDAIKDVKLFKGSAPAEYGGRLSSVLDLKMNEGNSKEYTFSGGVGLISSRLTFQGPIVKDKGSFIISGRRTYADLFLKLTEDLTDIQLYFYDLNMKANYRFGMNNRLFLSGYFGRDVFYMTGTQGSNWGNSTFTLRWNHLFSDQLFSNTSLIYSNYDYEIKVGDVNRFPDVSAAIRNYNLKSDFQYFANTQNTLKYGLNLIHYTFIPGEVAASEKNAVNYKKIEDKYALESDVYVSHEWDIISRLKINYGLRYSMFTVLGPGTVYSFDQGGETTDTTIYAGGDVIKRYAGLEPRFSLNYLLEASSSFKISYARNRQYIHLLSNSTSGMPVDLWHPCSKIVKPGIADQAALGYFRNFAGNNYETSIELYYKDLQNQVDYKNGAEVLMNEKVESQLVFGKGWAYGVELFIKKKFGKLNGWIGYTLSKTEREFKQINDGNIYPARQDRIHDISIVSIYEPNKKWTFSVSWVYHTGDAVTFPSGKYIVGEHTVNYYTERNGYRMPAYHRLDIGATLHFENESSLNFAIYNVYARRNAYTISFRKNENNPAKTEAVRMALFSIVPSITYNFKF
ncbi:MAG: TonB-dependent receptor plug domain-containing protein, partial [Calditrichales bacterium]|nr:TonB-dependent receptor plug domain-containing protein [Calditrichales bacterium]